jgi:hypothetical protein
MNMLTTNLAEIIDISYENSVSNHYQSVKDEIASEIQRRKNKINREKENISYYRRIIIELEEEERRRQEEEE